MLQSYEKDNTFARHSEKISQKTAVFPFFEYVISNIAHKIEQKRRNKTGILLLTTNSVIETNSQPLAELDN